MWREDGNPQEVTFRGVTYSSKLKCCYELGVDYKYVYNTKYRKKCTFEEALEWCLAKKEGKR